VEIHVTGDIAANVVRKILGGVAVGAVPVYCMSNVHHLRNLPVPASRLGWFRAPHWQQSRRERAAYCNECTAMLASIGAFDPDE
jgi:hypothetical protein